MKDDSGPAFPEVFSEFSEARNALTAVYSAGGISLRDYFAAAALPGIVTGSFAASPLFGRGWPDGWEDPAAMAYLAADAMLKERLK